MVSRVKARNPLTIEEREQIERGILLGESYGSIAAIVGRNKSTIIRESKRLGEAADYDAEKAQKDFELKQTFITGRKKVQKELGTVDQ